jgi:uncharacterized protein (TIGR01777 family)
MTIVIAGGSGQVGQILARAFQREGHEVVVLSQQPRAAPWRVVRWDAATLGPWSAEVDGADAVINLAGRSVNCRYTAANRGAILESRVRSTRVVGRAIAIAQCPPRVWLQASTATIYAHRYDAPNDERSGVIGGAERDAPSSWRFSIDVARAWEAALDEAAVSRTRKVAMRSAMIMSPDAGGIFDMLLGLARRGLGGRAGDGRQFVSWIHSEDFVASVRWLLEHEELDGPVNLAAPGPLPQAEFMRVLREAAGITLGLPAPAWALEIGALVLGTETELVLKSRRVVPGRLIEVGFNFRFPGWGDAARDLCRAWRLIHAGGRQVA